MNKGAIMSPCEKYRYQLWRIWNDDKPLVLFICLNPSTADANNDDPTLRRLMGFAYYLGYGGFYLGNLFALRTTYPWTLKRSDDPVGPDNDRHLSEMLNKCTTTVFAWGNCGELNNREAKVASMFQNPLCFGKTKSGCPKHPLYLSKDTQLIPFK